MSKYLNGELWIPCKDKMPEKYKRQKVWLSFSNEYGCFVRKALWEDGVFKWNNGQTIREQPDAWMPYCVPKPYKPKGGQE